MTEWTPDQPLRADATRQQVIDRMSHLHREAKSIGDATAPFYAVAMVDEVQKAFVALRATPPAAPGPVVTAEDIASFKYWAGSNPPAGWFSRILTALQGRPEASNA